MQPTVAATKTGGSDLGQLSAAGSLLLVLVALLKAYAVARYSLTTMTGLVVTAPGQVVLGTISFYGYLVMPLLALTAGWIVGRQFLTRGRQPEDEPTPPVWAVLAAVFVVASLLSTAEFLVTGLGLMLVCLQVELAIRPDLTKHAAALRRRRWLLTAVGAVAVLLPYAPTAMERWTWAAGSRLHDGLRIAFPSADVWGPALVLIAVAVAADLGLSANRLPNSGSEPQVQGVPQPQNSRPRHLVQGARERIRTTLKGRTFLCLTGVAAVWFLLYFIETPWVPAQVFVLKKPVEISLQNKHVENRALAVERVHAVVGFPLSGGGDSVTVLEADTRRIVRFPVDDVIVEPTCHRDHEQLPGKGSLWLLLRGRGYQSPNLSCATLLESLVPARGVAFVPNSPVLAATGWDGSLTWWSAERAAAVDRTLGFRPAPKDPPDISERARPVNPDSGQSRHPIAVSPGGRYLAVAGWDGRVTVNRQAPATSDPASRDALPQYLETVTAEPLTAATTYDRAPASVSALAFNDFNDQVQLAVAAADTLTLWDLRRATPTRIPLHVPPGATVNAVAFTGPDHTVLAAAGDHAYEVMLWDVRDPGSPQKLPSLSASIPVPLAEAGLKEAGYALASSPNGTLLAMAGGRRDHARTRFSDPYDADSSIHLWRLAPSQSAGNPKGPPSWETPGRCLPSGHEGAVNALTFNSAGTVLASASSDTTVRLWHVRGPNGPGQIGLDHAGTLTGHDGAVNALAFNSTGTILASASSDQTVRLWRDRDPRTSQDLVVGTGPHGNVVTTSVMTPEPPTPSPSTADDHRAQGRLPARDRTTALRADPPAGLAWEAAGRGRDGTTTDGREHRAGSQAADDAD